MAYTFNPFTGSFDNTPSTLKGDEAYSTLQTASADWSTYNYVDSTFLPLTGGTLSGNLTVGDGTNFTLYVADGSVGINTESPNEALTVVGNISSTGTIDGSNLNVSNWDSTYSTVVVNSATNWDNALANQYTHANFLPLSGGTLTGATRFNNDVTIFGNLSCSGTQTFANTVFTTTSAVSVVHFGSGPALWVGNNGNGDIASFYDTDQSVEVLHVGGNNGDFPNVGVKTSTPNKDFTVNGEISASGTIWAKDNNSDQWNSVYSTVYAKSATEWDNSLVQNYVTNSFLPLSGGTMTGKLTLTSSTTSSAPFKIIHGSDPSPVTPVLSAAGDIWLNGTLRYRDQTGTIRFVADINRPNVFTQNQVILAGTSTTNAGLRITQEGPGNAILVEDSSNPDSTPFVVDANGSVGIGLSSLSGVDAKLTVIGNVSSTGIIYASGGNSELWNSVYSTVFSNSSVNWNYQGTDLKELSANWQNSYTTLCSNSATWATYNFVNSTFLPLTGGTLSGNFVVGQGLATLFVQGTAVGINTESPNEALTVVGNISASGSLNLGQSNSTVLCVKSSGLVGINTEVPNETLTVIGSISTTDIIITESDIEIVNSNKGVILKSPNNTRWRIAVTNSGILTAASV